MGKICFGSKREASRPDDHLSSFEEEKKRLCNNFFLVGETADTIPYAESSIREGHLSRLSLVIQNSGE